ncbi:hypothetical protein FRC09_005824 [Ceratobasidium sp. 395]|nr:hypothetical protein FRC09_005824 [Ceratobasidium sp. 395]
MSTSPSVDRQSSLDYDGTDSCFRLDSTAHYSRRCWSEELSRHSVVSLASSDDLSFKTVPSIPVTFCSDYYEESISLLSIALSNEDPLPDNYIGFGDERPPLAIRSWPSLATIIAQLNSTPSVVDSLITVFQTVEMSRVARKQWKQLQARCVKVARMTGDRVRYNEENHPRLQCASEALYNAITHIGERALYWSQVSDLVAFVQFRKIREEISDHVYSLHFCYNRLSSAIHLTQKQWTEECEAIHRGRMPTLADRMHLKLEDAADSLDLRVKATQETFGLLSKIMDEKMAVLQNQATLFVATCANAERIVGAIRTVTNIEFLVQLLVGRQRIFNDNVQIKAGVTCDTYFATLSTNEKVAKKVLRITVSEREHVERYAHRFLKEAKLWATFISEYTLPLSGIGIDILEDDRHFQLYTVSPLMKNLDAVTYLRRHRENSGMKEGIMRIITDAAKGLQYLHSCEPPVVHAGMRGDNILITDSGGGILSGFELAGVSTKSASSRKVPPAVVTGETESQRWMAPEMFAENSRGLQTPSDVWGWAMAALELISGLPPYYQNKQPHTVMLDIRLNNRPLRAKHADFEKYALKPDEMWALLEKCWEIEPEHRPTIGEVVIELKKMARK